MPDFSSEFSSEFDAPFDDSETIISALDNVLAYWTFDEAAGSTAADSSGNGRDLAHLNTPTVGEPPLIISGFSVHYDGINQASSRTDLALSYQPTGKLSLAGWVTPESIPNGRRAFAAVGWGGAYDFAFVQEGDGTGWRPAGYIYDAGGNNRAVADNSVSSLGLARRHVAITIDRDAHVIKLYVDGVNTWTSSAAWIGTATPSAAPFMMGGRADNDLYFHGFKDEWVATSDVLTDAEILALYQAGLGSPASEEILRVIDADFSGALKAQSWFDDAYADGYRGFFTAAWTPWGGAATNAVQNIQRAIAAGFTPADGGFTGIYWRPLDQWSAALDLIAPILDDIQVVVLDVENGDGVPLTRAIVNAVRARVEPHGVAVIVYTGWGNWGDIMGYASPEDFSDLPLWDYDEPETALGVWPTSMSAAPLHLYGNWNVGPTMRIGWQLRQKDVLVTFSGQAIDENIFSRAFIDSITGALPPDPTPTPTPTETGGVVAPTYTILMRDGRTGQLLAEIARWRHLSWKRVDLEAGSWRLTLALQDWQRLTGRYRPPTLPAVSNAPKLDGAYLYLPGVADPAGIPALLDEWRDLGFRTIVTSSLRKKTAGGGVDSWAWELGTIDVLNVHLKAILDGAAARGMSVYVGLVESSNYEVSFENEPNSTQDMNQTSWLVPQVLASAAGSAALVGWSVVNETPIGYETRPEIIAPRDVYYARQVNAVRAYSSLPVITAPYFGGTIVGADGNLQTPTAVAIKAESFMAATGIDRLVWQDSAHADGFPVFPSLRTPYTGADYYAALIARVGPDKTWGDLELGNATGFTGGGYKPTSMTRLERQLENAAGVGQRLSWLPQLQMSAVSSMKFDDSERLMEAYLAYSARRSDLAVRKPTAYTWQTAPDAGYPDAGGELNDGDLGDALDYAHAGWTGIGSSPVVDLDFGEVVTMRWLSFHAFSKSGYGIKPPTHARIEYRSGGVWTLATEWNISIADFDGEYVISNPTAIDIPAQEWRLTLVNGNFTFFGEIEAVTLVAAPVLATPTILPDPFAANNVIEILRDDGSGLAVEFQGMVTIRDGDAIRQEWMFAGPDLKGWLQKPEINPGVMQYDEQVAVTAEAAMKHYVEANLPRVMADYITSATLDVPASSERGGLVDYNGRYQRLLDALIELGRKGELLHSVELNPSKTGYVYDVALPRDRTEGSMTPVVFSPETFARALAYRQNYQGKPNSLTVLGTGSGAARVVEVVEDANSIAAVGRTEGHIDARDADTTDKLQTVGLAALAEALAAGESVSASPSLSGPNRYRLDFDLGDEVTISIPDFGVAVNRRIAEVGITLEGNDKPEEIKLEFGLTSDVLARMLRRIELRSHAVEVE